MCEEEGNKGREEAMNDEVKTEASIDPHQPARPLRFVKDGDGNGWLCDRDVDPSGDLEAQGCWRCEDMGFPMGGR